MKQCSLINNGSELPLNLYYRAELRLDTRNFFNKDIGKIMQNLDPNKVHGQDKVSIHR